MGTLHDLTPAQRIVKDAKRGEDADPLGELNPLDVKFFRNARVNLQIAIVDPIVMRRQLMFLIDELPHLVAQVDRITDRRSKSLLVHSTLQRWSQAFARMAMPANRYKRRNGNGSGT